jgi:spermidine synthase
MKKALSLSIIGAGFTALAGQIIFVREFLTSFSSDELSIGLVLASWLVCGALGSLLLGKFSDRIKPGYFIIWFAQMSLFFLLPAGIICIRCARQFFQINPGQIIPFHIVSLASFLILLPLCGILGFLFSFSCKLYASETGSAAGSIARVYALESLGSMAGGLLVTFILVRLLSNLQIISILCLLNAGLGLLFVPFFRKLKPLCLVFNLLLIMVVLFSWWMAGPDKLDTYLLSKQWPGYHILASRNSLYGNIVLLKRGEDVSFFENGVRLYTVPDRQSSEEAAHFTLLEHKAPKDILLIGGGSGGLLDEILKHPVRHVDYLELDALIIKMSKEFLAPQYSLGLKNPKISVINLDGRYFIKSRGRKYDCIIVHLGDPYTAQVNRFYTEEFFREAAGCLKEKGVISFYLNASESYINADMGNFLRSIYATLNRTFPEIKVFPGEAAYFLAANSKGVLTYDYNLLMQRAKERNLDLEYVREYYLFSKLSSQKIDYLENLLLENRGIKINYDFRPSAYYYGIISWMGRFKGSLFPRILKFVSAKIIWLILSIFLIIFMVSKRLKQKKSLVLVSLAVAGFSQSAIQVILLFSFQIIYGYLFYKLGVIFTFFMMGLALGSWWIARIINKIRASFRAIMWVQLGIFIFSLSLPITLYWLSSTRGQWVSWFGANIYFPAASLVSGLLGGLLFPLANKIYLDETGSQEYGRVSALSYGFDLFGSCLGAAISAVFLIPLLGIGQACLVLAFLNLMIAIFFLTK